MTIEEAMKLEPGEVNRILAEFEYGEVRQAPGGYVYYLENYCWQPISRYTESLDACQTVKERLTHPQLNRLYDLLAEMCGTKGVIKATADQTARALAATVKGDL